MTLLAILSCGPGTSLQDAGRVGWQRYGVSNSGAMDRLALAHANALVGNAPGAGAIEFVLMGGQVRVEGGRARLALAGATCPATLEGAGGPVAPGTSFTLEEGRTLTLGAARAGTFAYLAVAGGLAVAPALGSVSLQPRAGIGGLDGRALRAGDRLPLALAAPPAGPERRLAPVELEAGAGAGSPVRVVLGPQDDHFTAAGIATLLGSSYAVTNEADRMGYRLSGPVIEHGEKGFNIISDGIVAGAVQVPGSGEPIVLMADRQTTGGYPKIATVISADLRRVAQSRPGDRLRFAALGVREAQSLARARAAEVAALAGRARAIVGSDAPAFTSEELLALNLAGAATDALAETT